jgi:hypothetical protein
MFTIYFQYEPYAAAVLTLTLRSKWLSNIASGSPLVLTFGADRRVAGLRRFDETFEWLLGVGGNVGMLERERKDFEVLVQASGLCWRH